MPKSIVVTDVGSALKFVRDKSFPIKVQSVFSLRRSRVVKLSESLAPTVRTGLRLSPVNQVRLLVLK